MKSVLGWLGRRTLLYVAILAALGFYVLVWPSASTYVDQGSLRQDIVSGESLSAQTRSALAVSVSRWEALGENIETLPGDALAARLKAAQSDLDRLQAEAREGGGWLDSVRPSRIVDNYRRKLQISLLTREIGLLQAARSRQAASAALAPLAQVPTERAIATVAARCTRARQALQNHNRRNRVDRTARDWIYGQGPQLEKRRDDQCRLAETLSSRREAGIAAARTLMQANARYDALAAQSADALRQVNSGAGRATLRDLMEKAALLLIGILLAPYAIRLLFWFVLAPMAMRRGAIRVAVPGGRGPPVRQSAPSAVSTGIVLQPGEELLVRQNYLQTLSDAVESRTKWLLDARHPLSSMASGMMFLTRIRGDGQKLTISDTQNAFAEVAIIDLPAGSACVLQPRALAAVVQQRNAPMRITSHWRLFSLNAWLTMQLRFLVFHGPARLVLKGGRGVRVEPAAEGRILGQEQMVGFSADLAYSVTRNETFWPYFLGKESLLKDRVHGGEGVLIVEESPMASQRGGVRGGLEGMVDAGLKAFGL